MADLLPESVRRAKIETSISGDMTTYRYNNLSVESGKTDSWEERWQRKQKLGSGGFGHVYTEQRLDSFSKQFRAVKIIQKDRCKPEYLITEIEAMLLFSAEKYQDCFVKTFGWYEGIYNNAISVFIRMEYLPFGDLNQTLNTHPKFTDDDARDVIAQILEGLVFMHEAGFVHRDLKPSNILVNQKQPYWRIKIGDFGITKRLIEAAPSTVIGTEAFAAPEQRAFWRASHGHKGYTEVVDIWPVGVMCCMLTTGRSSPFAEVNNLADLMTFHRDFVDTLRTYGTTNECHDFVHALVSIEARYRPTARQALSFDWIQKQHHTLESLLDPTGSAILASEILSLRGTDDSETHVEHQSPLDGLADDSLMPASSISLAAMTNDAGSFAPKQGDSGLLSTWRAYRTRKSQEKESKRLELEKKQRAKTRRLQELKQEQFQKLCTAAGNSCSKSEFEEVYRQSGLRSSEATTMLDKDGQSLLHLAVARDCGQIIQYLLEEVKMDIDTRDRTGRTPLFCAANSDTAWHLATWCGADPLAKDKEGTTAVSHLRRPNARGHVPALTFYREVQESLEIAHRKNLAVKVIAVDYGNDPYTILRITMRVLGHPIQQRRRTGFKKGRYSSGRFPFNETFVFGVTEDDWIRFFTEKDINVLNDHRHVDFSGHYDLTAAIRVGDYADFDSSRPVPPRIVKIALGDSPKREEKVDSPRKEGKATLTVELSALDPPERHRPADGPPLPTTRNPLSFKYGT